MNCLHLKAFIQDIAKTIENIRHLHFLMHPKDGLMEGVREWSGAHDDDVDRLLESLSGSGVPVESFRDLMSLKCFEENFAISYFVEPERHSEGQSEYYEKIINDALQDDCGGYADVMYEWLMRGYAISKKGAESGSENATYVRLLDYLGLNHLEISLRSKSESWKLKEGFAVSSANSLVKAAL